VTVGAVVGCKLAFAAAEKDKVSAVSVPSGAIVVLAVTDDNPLNQAALSNSLLYVNRLVAGAPFHDFCVLFIS
jgi:hypothetical protein